MVDEIIKDYFNINHFMNAYVLIYMLAQVLEISSMIFGLCWVLEWEFIGSLPGHFLFL